MGDLELIDDDFEAARKYIAWVKDDQILQKWDVDRLAHLHAELGPSLFQLYFGMRPPRNDHEVAMARFYLKVDSEEENRERLREDEKQPLSLRLVQSCYETLAERLFFLGRSLQSICAATGAGHDFRQAIKEGRRAERYIREIRRTLPFSVDQLQNIDGFAAESRATRNLAIPQLKSFSAGTALLLVHAVFQRVEQLWKESTKVAGRDLGAAARHFYSHYFDTVPRPDDLTALLTQEAAVCRLNFRSADGQNHSSHPSPKEAKGKVATREVESPSPQPAGKVVNAKLSSWAVGLDEKERGILFREEKGRWQYRCQLEIPKGNATKLLAEFARHGGSLSSDEAATLFGTGYGGKNKKGRVRVATYALMKIKTAIKEGIKQVSKNSEIKIENPVPRVGNGWVAEIEIGYAVENEEHRLIFQRREELERPL